MALRAVMVTAWRYVGLAGMVSLALSLAMLPAGSAAAQEVPVPIASGPVASGPVASGPVTSGPVPGEAADPLLDPDAPLPDMPGIGVDWPTLDAAPADTPADVLATSQEEEATAAGFASNDAEVRYAVVVEGLEGIGSDLLRQRFADLSVLRQHEGKPANAAQLDRRGRQDADLLTELLKAEGYYDARVRARIGPAGSDDDEAATPVASTGADGRAQVTLVVNAGQPYRLGRVTLPGIEDAGPEAPALVGALALGENQVANTDQIVAAELRLREEIGKRGFPFAKVDEPVLTVDRAAGTATLALPVAPGPSRVFGRVVTPPNRIFGADHIEDIARFRPGQPYDESALVDLRRAIVQTGLVASVDIAPVEGKTPGTVDISVQMQPAPMRTIAGEIGYGTGEGARAEVSWTHRNLFPPEGALTLRGVVGTQEQLASIALRRNNFGMRDRVLSLQASAANLVRDAYRAKTLSLSGTLERQTNIFFQKAWVWSVGAELAASDERDVIVSTGAPRQRIFFIGALPTSLTYDGSDDLLNPTRGFRLGARLSPEVSLQGSVFAYARVQLDASVYRPLGDSVVLAGRVRLGTIVGAPRDQVAPSRRFYAGGGASVRGYGFQDIGPRDPNNDPIGGRSLTEFSLEARVKAFGPFSLVPFIDAGNIYTDPLPRLRDFRLGAGLGLRYQSNFGPIRIDVGTPLNPQPGDPRVAVYVSLGQAF